MFNAFTFAYGHWTWTGTQRRKWPRGMRNLYMRHSLLFISTIHSLAATQFIWNAWKIYENKRYAGFDMTATLCARVCNIPSCACIVDFRRSLHFEMKSTMDVYNKQNVWIQFLCCALHFISFQLVFMVVVCLHVEFSFVVIFSKHFAYLTHSVFWSHFSSLVFG